MQQKLNLQTLHLTLTTPLAVTLTLRQDMTTELLNFFYISHCDFQKLSFLWITLGSNHSFHLKPSLTFAVIRHFQSLTCNGSVIVIYFNADNSLLHV